MFEEYSANIMRETFPVSAKLFCNHASWDLIILSQKLFQQKLQHHAPQDYFKVSIDQTQLLALDK